MDVQDVALTDGRDVALTVGLVVVVLIDDGDDLLLREVVDVALAAYEECTGLGGRDAVDGEVALLVGKQAVLGAADKGARQYLAAADSTTSARYGTALDGRNIAALRVVLTTVVVGLVLMGLVDGQRGDVILLIAGQCQIAVAADHLADSVWCTAYLEGGVHHVVIAGIRDGDGGVVALLIGQGIVLYAGKLLTNIDLSTGEDGGLHILPARFFLSPVCSFGTIVCCRVVYALRHGIASLVAIGLVADFLFTLVVAVVLVLLSFMSAECGVDEQVEGIVVIVKLAVVGCRQRTPGF